ncbi:hypothetical protein COV17_02450 [Candidatus Woesearchaeota archaeon CG10_big_fil_rev_8_21_14_0_10_36_11]|nr:MAG: hypothetical protein COV17_02450 [Candidatus Woesearchaeota archaeon CG10_big_fil_rev_8_21_14_0_10_36_11]
MITEFLTILAGVIVILALAQIIIKNSISLAKHYGLSGTFVGLTILSIGTSIPEIMTHIIGSINIVRHPETINTLSGLLIGTNIGSDIFQQNFVLPIIGIIGTIIVIRKNLFVEMGGLIAASVLVWVLSLGGLLTRLEGLILLVAYIAYLIYLKQSNVSENIGAENNLSKKGIVWAISLVSVCFIIMGFVTDRVVDAATIIVEHLSISASFFGIIMLGVASALPELTTSFIAIMKGKKELSAGILIGSNITNPLFGIGIGALISTYKVPNVAVFYDLPVKIITAFLLLYFLLRNEKLNKWEAVVLITLFIVYLIVRQIYFPVDF